MEGVCTIYFHKKSIGIAFWITLGREWRVCALEATRFMIFMSFEKHILNKIPLVQFCPVCNIYRQKQRTPTVERK